MFGSPIFGNPFIGALRIRNGVVGPFIKVY